jgi:hypothetical protein
VAARGQGAAGGDAGEYGAGIRLRHEQHISFWKWRITAASIPGIEIANWSSSIRWSMEA